MPDKVRLNQRIRGIQGADWVHRMKPFWNMFLEELHELINDPLISEFLNLQVIKDAIPKVQEGPKPELAFDPELRNLLRGLIVYRFLKNLI